MLRLRVDVLNYAVGVLRLRVDVLNYADVFHCWISLSEDSRNKVIKCTAGLSVGKRCANNRRTEYIIFIVYE